MVHFVRGADLLYFALLHQGDSVAYAHRLNLVVGNQNGGAAGFPLAADFFYLVTTMGRRAQLIDDVGGLSQEQQVMIGPNDRLFVASFSNSTSEVVHTAEQTLRQGIPVVALTDHPLSPLTTHSSVCFHIEDAAVHDSRPLGASMCLVQTLVVGLGAGS